MPATGADDADSRYRGMGGAARWNTGLIASPDWIRDTPGMRVSTSSMKR
jgi:hypothetical protein